MNNFAVIICTKDRPKDIMRLLDSIKLQSFIPELIMIVDGSDNPIKDYLTPYQSVFNINYFTVRPPSLPKQRNMGIARIPAHIEWVAFLDDDLELLPNTLTEIKKAATTFKTQKPLGAICMLISNVDNVPYKPLNRFWMLDYPTSGIFLKSGIPTYLRQAERTEEVFWVSGGTTVWRADVLRNYKYDEWFAGTGYFEDIDYSYRVSKEYSLLLCGTSKCYHYQYPTPAKKVYSLGIWQVTTLWYFVNKNPEFSKLLTFWSILGIFMNNLIFGILKPSSMRLRKAFGNLKGLYMVFTGSGLKQRSFQKGV